MKACVVWASVFHDNILFWLFIRVYFLPLILLNVQDVRFILSNVRFILSNVCLRNRKMDEEFRNIGRMKRKDKKYPYRKIMIPKSSGYESMSACVSNGRASLQVRLPILSARRNEPKKRLSKALSKANSEHLKKWNQRMTIYGGRYLKDNSKTSSENEE